jgi:hypothetical protein
MEQNELVESNLPCRTNAAYTRSETRAWQEYPTENMAAYRSIWFRSSNQWEYVTHINDKMTSHYIVL